jgi:hypothetical protein
MAEMTEVEIRAIVTAVLAEQKDQAKTIAEETVSVLLMSFGIEEDDHREMRADFAHLRKWRKSFDQAQSLTFKVVITTIITGFVTVVWMGVKTFLGK